jgi:hypothetical protein
MRIGFGLRKLFRVITLVIMENKLVPLDFILKLLYIHNILLLE